MRSTDPTVTFEEVTVKRETDAALLCLIDDKEYWIPKSQVHEDSGVTAEGESGTLIVSEWLAIEKGLV